DQMIEVTVFQFQFAVGHGGGDHESAAFDAVGNDAMFDALELVHAFDADFRRAVAANLGAHFVEHIGAVQDFGFAGGANEYGSPFGHRRGAHPFDRPKSRRTLGPPEIHAAAFQLPPDIADDVAVFSAELCTEFLQAADVKVHRPIADRAPA